MLQIIILLYEAIIAIPNFNEILFEGSIKKLPLKQFLIEDIVDDSIL